MLTLCAAFTASYDAFISLAKYDDEGYMMWTVKNFLAGHPLYDQVVTVYGPFYYLYEWVILSVTGAPAASDSLRLVSAAFWVAAALVAFLLAYRATGSLVVAAVVHLLAFRALGFIGEETAHPQEACILLLLALGRAFYIADRKLRLVMMGVLGGAMAATKINLGIFVVVALTVGLTYAQPRGWLRNARMHRRLLRRARAPGGTHVGPPRGLLGHLLLRPDLLLACLHPARRVGTAVERQLQSARCRGRRRRLRRDRRRHLLLSTHPGQHAQ